MSRCRSIERVWRSAISIANLRAIERQAVSMVANGPAHCGFSPALFVHVGLIHQPDLRRCTVNAGKA